MWPIVTCDSDAGLLAPVISRDARPSSRSLKSTASALSRLRCGNALRTAAIELIIGASLMRDQRLALSSVGCATSTVPLPSTIAAKAKMLPSDVFPHCADDTRVM